MVTINPFKLRFWTEEVHVPTWLYFLFFGCVFLSGYALGGGF